MKYLIFGTGDYYDCYKKWFAKEDIVALLDNILSKQSRKWAIISLEDILYGKRLILGYPQK